MAGNTILDAVRGYAVSRPDAPALVGKTCVLSYRELAEAIAEASTWLASPRPLLLALDNSPAWAVLDLAAMDSRIPVVPLPFFFSAEQVIHALFDSGAGSLLTDRPEYYEKVLVGSGLSLLPSITTEVAGQVVTCLRVADVPIQPLPEGTAKITYTSGTTGAPKGVCLGGDAMRAVAGSLRAGSDASSEDRHLCLLPLATLLENIGGIYAPLLAGASSHLIPLEEVGLSGASGIDLARMAGALHASEASTVIMTPELLQGLVVAIESGFPLPEQLRFVAVGGATVGVRLLERARSVGLPVFEGYGLSECASVVALNTSSEYRSGSVGRPLPHAHVHIAADGEIMVSGALLLGYTGKQTCPVIANSWATGDIGYLDDDGFLFITGRKKNIFITSFGRNVSPEWVERELTLNPAIAQAAVFGEARPFNVAVVIARGNAQAVDQAIAVTNELLPDYARIGRWIPASTPFSPANQQMTPNGRLRREAIYSLYREAINQLYEEHDHAVL